MINYIVSGNINGTKMQVLCDMTQVKYIKKLLKEQGATDIEVKVDENYGKEN